MYGGGMRHSSNPVDDTIPTAQSKHSHAVVLKVSEPESSARQHLHLGVESFGDAIGFGEAPHCHDRSRYICQNMSCLDVPILIHYKMKPALDVRFFITDAGSEPVRAWLKSLPAIERKVIGEDIKTVQLGWPLGMPLVRNLGDGIWEVRIKLENRIVRVLFALEQSTMVLLHGFIKKQQTTPKPDLDLAKDRLKQLKRRS